MKASYQTLQTTKMNPYTLLKTVRLASFQKPTIAIRFYLQVCPSVPPFVLARLFISSFHVLRDYFFASLNLVAVPTVSYILKCNSRQSSVEA